MFGLFGQWRHRRFKGLLSSYVDGRLDERQAGELELHLATCPRCQGEVESLKATVGLLRSLPRATQRRSFVLSERPLALPATPAYLWGMRGATSVAALALVLLLAGDLLGMFSRDAISSDGPAVQAVQEAGPDAWQVLKSATESDTLSSVATEEAASLRDAVETSEDAPALQSEVAKEESLPLTALEVALGSLLAVLALLTYLVTWRLRRRWAVV